jgi:DNA-binding transcriptional MerR regulator
MSKDLTIGEAAKAVGLSVDAVRFYERQGIMAPPPRMAGGRRAYGPQQMLELTFIARGRAVRMPLSEIGRYLSLRRQLIVRPGPQYPREAPSPARHRCLSDACRKMF